MELSDTMFSVTMPGIYESDDCGAYWPSADLYRRRQVYARNMMLYRGEHTELFRSMQPETLDGSTDPATQRYRAALMSFNLLRKSCHSLADLMFREAPIIEAGRAPEAQAALDRISARSALPRVLYKMSRSTIPVKGDGVLKLFIDATGTAIISSVPPELVEWDVDPLDGERFEGATIGVIVRDKRAGRKRGHLLLKEIHRAGTVDMELYEIANQDEKAGIYRVGNKVSLAAAYDADDEVPPEHYETGLNVPTIWKLPNIEVDGAFFGESDFTVTAVQLQRAITTLLEDWYRNVIKRSYGGTTVLPRSMEGMTAPGPLLEASRWANVRTASTLQQGRTRTIDRSKLETLFEDKDDKGVARHFSVESTHESVSRLWERLVKALAFELGADVNALFESMGQIAISGRALQFRLAPSLSIVAAKTVFLVPVLEQVLLAAQVFENTHREATGASEPKKYEPVLPRVELRHGLPRDEESEGTVAQNRINSGTLSRKSAIKRLDNTDDLGAEEEIKRIIDEEIRFGSVKADLYQTSSGVMSGRGEDATPGGPMDPEAIQKRDTALAARQSDEEDTDEDGAETETATGLMA